MSRQALRLDLSIPRRLHIVGAGGAGMAPIAEVLVAMGHSVSGSDRVESANVARLRSLGCKVDIPGASLSAVGLDALAASSAVASDDPELVQARALGVVVLRRSEILAAICECRSTIAVSGTHGKTTTSAFCAAALAGAGLRPSWVIGAELRGLNSGARWDCGKWMVVEADESDSTMLALPAAVALVTSIEPDHVEHYGSFEALFEAFGAFVNRASLHSVIGIDDPVARELADQTKRGSGAVFTYGRAGDADYRIRDLRMFSSRTDFSLEFRGTRLGPITVSVPGLHNALNAAGAMAAALTAGAEFDHAAAGLAVAPKVARRFETRGVVEGVTYVDDYAHLPGEVSAALATARSGDWDRVVCVFQPHRYSRTQALGNEFGACFAGADRLWVTDVYPAGEAPRPGVSGAVVARAVDSSRPELESRYQPDFAALAREIRSELRSGDLCLMLGAGDITRLYPMLVGPGEA